MVPSSTDLSALAGAAEALRDVVSQVADGNQQDTTRSLLLLGPPGAGEPSLFIYIGVLMLPLGLIHHFAMKLCRPCRDQHEQSVQHLASQNFERFLKGMRHGCL